MAVRSLSLFSGCLGLDLGLERAGIEAVAYADSDPCCRRTIEANRPGARVFGDVFDASLIHFARKRRPAVIVGGPPCQSFSTIGRRRLLRDERGRAVLGFLRAVDAIRPAAFLLENVTGIVSAPGVVDELRDAFSGLGYGVSWAVLNAAAFGVPQRRRRFIMVGVLGQAPALPAGTGGEPVPLRACIADLEGRPGPFTPFSGTVARFMPKIPEGGNWKSLGSRDRKVAMGRADLKSGGLTAFYRRLDYGRPSPTLMTSPTQRATTLCHPRQDRPLSVAEYKRIQCFPDDWAVCGSTRDQYRQLGNAVPVLFAAELGSLLRRAVT